MSNKTDLSGVIPLLAHIHSRRLAHEEELAQLASEALLAGAEPRNVARVLGAAEDNGSLLARAGIDPAAVESATSVSYWTKPPARVS
jgi:hypothetical protein